MKYGMTITHNAGNYENVKFDVSDAESFDQCRQTIIEDFKACGLVPSSKIRQILGWK